MNEGKKQQIQKSPEENYWKKYFWKDFLQTIFFDLLVSIFFGLVFYFLYKESNPETFLIIDVWGKKIPLNFFAIYSSIVSFPIIWYGIVQDRKKKEKERKQKEIEEFFEKEKQKRNAW